MKLSVCHLLLPPLLLLFCCHCLAAVHGKVDADNQHSINKTTPSFKATRSSLKVNTERSKDHSLTINFSRADLPCPDETAILPCSCSLDIDNRTQLDCTLVESIDQLVVVFQQDFPVKELYHFTMTNNSAIREFPSFMNGITFQSVNLSPGPFILAEISEDFFFDLKDTLTNFLIDGCKLTTDFFPFSMLSSMNQLQYLNIFLSDINWIPQFQAPKLTQFGLILSPVQLLASGTFPIGTGPMAIDVSNNQINTIEVGSFFFTDQNSLDSYGQIRIDLQYNQLQSVMSGTFSLRNGPTEIYLSFNQISSIEPGTFFLPASTGADGNEPISIYLWSNQLQSIRASTFPLRNGQMYISLYENQISSIEYGSFLLPASTDLLIFYLDLENNLLTTVDEAVFGSIMPFITTLFLNGNPLTCGCDIAWLVLNADYLARVDLYVMCADGTMLHDLDPQQFIDLC